MYIHKNLGIVKKFGINL